MDDPDKKNHIASDAINDSLRRFNQFAMRKSELGHNSS
jgi:hypothetical protein